MELDRFEHLRRHVETPEMKVDHRMETVPVAESSGGVLDPLDPRVDPRCSDIGDPMVDGVDHTFEVALDHPGNFLCRLQARADHPAVPAEQGGSGPNLAAVLPGRPAVFFQGPSPLRLDCHSLQRLDQLLASPAQTRALGQPEMLHPFQGGVPFFRPPPMLNPGNLGPQDVLELAAVEVAPAAGARVVLRAHRLARWARPAALPRLHLHLNNLLGRLELHLDHRPGGRQVQNSLVQSLFIHGPTLHAWSCQPPHNLGKSPSL